MLGKYSPTVNAAYDAGQNWYDIYSGTSRQDIENEWYNQYDPEGYDEYGYNEKGIDRAGNHEYSYSSVCECCGQVKDSLYFSVLSDWGFDGVKPVRREK